MIQELYTEAIITYGKEAQSIVAIEELSELTKEITKMLRGSGSRSHLTEEIADVEIMIDQLKLMYDVEYTELQVMKKQKLDRLRERLKGVVHEKSSM